jgi:hypothetical protein
MQLSLTYDRPWNLSQQSTSNRHFYIGIQGSFSAWLFLLMSEEKVHRKKGFDVENELYTFGRIQYNQSTAKILQNWVGNNCLLNSKYIRKKLQYFFIFSSSELTNIWKYCYWRNNVIQCLTHIYTVYIYKPVIRRQEDDITSLETVFIYVYLQTCIVQ